MFKIKAIYKGNPMYGMYDCYKIGKEYSFYLLDTYKPFEQIELVSKSKKQPSCYFTSWDKIIEDCEIIDIDTELLSEHELLIHHPIWNEMKVYMRDRKINLIII